MPDGDHDGAAGHLGRHLGLSGNVPVLVHEAQVGLSRREAEGEHAQLRRRNLGNRLIWRAPYGIGHLVKLRAVVTPENGRHTPKRPTLGQGGVIPVHRRKTVAKFVL